MFLSSVLALVVATALMSLAPVGWAVEQFMVTAPDASPGAQFGYSVALTRGDEVPLAVIGAPMQSVNGRRTGAAYVMSFGGVAILVPSDGGEGDRFGASVAVVVRGTRAVVLVGAPNHRSGGVASGAAYLFEQNPDSPTEWREVKKLMPSDAADNDGFGAAVGVAERFAVIGAQWHDGSATDSGCAYVFGGTRALDGWTELARLQAPDAMERDQFGRSLALDGGTVLIGAPFHPGGGSDSSGAAYLFNSDSGGVGAWGLNSILTPTDEARSARFGRTRRTRTEPLLGPPMYGWSVSLDLTPPGRAMIGAPGDAGNGPNGGAAYIFERARDGTDSWAQVVKLTASGDGDLRDEFGTSVAIAGDFALVGSPHDDDAGANSGSVYLFRRDQGGEDMWGRVGKMTAVSGLAGDEFGRACALAIFGSARTSPVGLVGRPLADLTVGEDAGAAHSLLGFEETLLALPALKDSFLRKDHPNLNEGAHSGLRIQKEPRNRLVVGFDGEAMAAFLSGKGAANPPRLLKATLVLTIKMTPHHWSKTVPTVEAHPLLVDFAEGNGRDAELIGSFRTRGSGPGVTWNCSADADISNHRADCFGREWEGGIFDPLPTATPVEHFEGQWGEVEWDVTADAQDGVNAWLLRKTAEWASGEVWYYSKDGAAIFGNPDLAPRLILEIETEDEFVSNSD